jgi:hypothetical protein
MLLPDWIVLYMALAGCGALILGQRKVGITLVAPACIRWLMLPLLSPMLKHVPIALVVIATPIVVIFGSLLLLDRVVSSVYGPRAGGHVTGTYLVRVFDAIGRGLIFGLVFPFRLALRSIRRR